MDVSEPSGLTGEAVLEPSGLTGEALLGGPYAVVSAVASRWGPVKVSISSQSKKWSSS